jgi:hypothetical protein
MLRWEKRMTSHYIKQNLVIAQTLLKHEPYNMWSSWNFQQNVLFARLKMIGSWWWDEKSNDVWSYYTKSSDCATVAKTRVQKSLIICNLVETFNWMICSLGWKWLVLDREMRKIVKFHFNIKNVVFAQLLLQKSPEKLHNKHRLKQRHCMWYCSNFQLNVMFAQLKIIVSWWQDKKRMISNFIIQNVVIANCHHKWV